VIGAALAAGRKGAQVTDQYDLVGDIHGHAAELEALLARNGLCPSRQGIPASGTPVDLCRRFD